MEDLKTLVIGGAGFLGSHLVAALSKAGDEVCVQDIIPAEAASKLRDVSKRITYVWKSTLDMNADDIEGYNRIVHLAAQGDAPLATSSPRWTYALNLDSTMAVLQTLKQSVGNGTSRVKMLYMSSDAVYGRVPPERLPAREEEPMRPVNTYGASKAAAELLINAYVSQWNLPVIILRSTTMFGEGSRLSQAVPIFIRQALRGEPITVEGDGSQTRDINYVGNATDAIVAALNSPLDNGTWNIGSGTEISIKELAKLIIDLTNSKSEIIFKPWRLGERGLRLFLSIDKARRDLHYSPTCTLEAGLRRTIDWIKRYG